MASSKAIVGAFWKGNYISVTSKSFFSPSSHGWEGTGKVKGKEMGKGGGWPAERVGELCLGLFSCFALFSIRKLQQAARSKGSKLQTNHFSETLVPSAP